MIFKSLFALTSFVVVLSGSASAEAEDLFATNNFDSIWQAQPAAPSADRESTVGLRLLKTIFRNNDAHSGTSLSNSAIALPGTAVTVRCPAGAKCTIEAEVEIGWAASANALAEGAATVDGNAIAAAGGIALYPSGVLPAIGSTHWTYIKKVGAGPHTVQGFALALGTAEWGAYSMKVRLYRR